MAKQSHAAGNPAYDSPGYRRLIVSLLVVLFAWQVALLGIASATLDRINSISDMVGCVGKGLSLYIAPL